jgi:hypothetical protein
MAGKGGCALLSSAYALDERKAPKALQRYDGLLPLLEIALDPPEDLVVWAQGHRLPVKDAPILASAVAGRADLLVTGPRKKRGRCRPLLYAGPTPARNHTSL